MGTQFEAFWHGTLRNNHHILDSEELLAHIVRYRHLDRGTAVHALRTAVSAAAIAHEIKIDLDRIVALTIAGNVHDVGKYRDNHLYTDGRTLDEMTQDERNVVYDHPNLGHKLLRDLWPYPANVQRMAQVLTLEHHLHQESADPAKVTDQDGVILAMADSIDVISHPYDRPSTVSRLVSEGYDIDAQHPFLLALQITDKHLRPLPNLSMQDIGHILLEQSALIEEHSVVTATQLGI